MRLASAVGALGYLLVVSVPDIEKIIEFPLSYGLVSNPACIGVNKAKMEPKTILRISYSRSVNNLTIKQNSRNLDFPVAFQDTDMVSAERLPKETRYAVREILLRGPDEAASVENNGWRSPKIFNQTHSAGMLLHDHTRPGLLNAIFYPIDQEGRAFGGKKRLRLEHGGFGGVFGNADLLLHFFGLSLGGPSSLEDLPNNKAGKYGVGRSNDNREPCNNNIRPLWRVFLFGLGGIIAGMIISAFGTYTVLDKRWFLGYGALTVGFAVIVYACRSADEVVVTQSVQQQALPALKQQQKGSRALRSDGVLLSAQNRLIPSNKAIFISSSLNIF